MVSLSFYKCKLFDTCHIRHIFSIFNAVASTTVTWCTSIVLHLPFYFQQFPVYRQLFLSNIPSSALSTFKRETFEFHNQNQIHKTTI